MSAADESSFMGPLLYEVIDALEDFRVLRTAATGPVLYPARAAHFTDYEKNLGTAMAASALRVSLAHAAKRYPQEVPESTSPDDSRYLRAYRLAKRHLIDTEDQFTDDPGPTTFGVFAASVALHRLHNSFFSAHLLYQLGFQLEGDTVARHMLEQIGWALEAASAGDDEKALDSISSSGSVRALKSLFEPAGRLYGYLSQSAHAGLSSHREFFSIDEAGRGLIHSGRRPDQRTARVMVEVADAWSIVFETTQFGYLTAFSSVSPDDRSVRLDRPFKLAADALMLDWDER